MAESPEEGPVVLLVPTAGEYSDWGYLLELPLVLEELEQDHYPTFSLDPLLVSVNWNCLGP